MLHDSQLIIWTKKRPKTGWSRSLGRLTTWTARRLKEMNKGVYGTFLYVSSTIEVVMSEIKHFRHFALKVHFGLSGAYFPHDTFSDAFCVMKRISELTRDSPLGQPLYAQVKCSVLTTQIL